MPEGAHKIIRKVNIHYYNDNHIYGFQFFDKDGLTIYQIGDTRAWNVETVLIAEDEVIVGVACKLHTDSQSLYTDFQFQIARLTWIKQSIVTF